MRTVHVTRAIPAPAGAIFDLLADHAHYDRFRGIRGSELVRAGEPPPNGVGAMRKAWAYALTRGFGRVLEDVERMLT